MNNIVFANGLSELGGAILFNQSITEVSISNSLFTNNSAPTSNSAGGAINFNFDASHILFENTTFENNYAGYGGSITFDNNARFIQFDGCNFRTNKERESKIIGGGALYFIKDAGAVFIENCEFDNLTANTGGAMHFEGRFVLSMINNTKFTNNKAQTKNTTYGGGAISIEGNADFTGIFDSEFINNSATTHGGAIKIMGNTSTLVINNTVFDGNYAPYAGALCLKGAKNLIISDSNFTNNKGTDEDIVGGGAIYIIGNLTESTIMNSKFENNSARTGGAIFVEGNLNTTTFNHNQFTNNSAFTNNTKYGGGAIAVQGNATNNKFEKSIFMKNTATTHGGAIKFMDNDENNTFNKCIFMDNYAPYGGSIAVSNSSQTLNITDCIFTNTKEPEKEIIGGGAIYFISDANELYITNSEFKALTARAGGAIYIEGDLNGTVIAETNFIDNKATTNNTYYGGGAIDVEGNAKDVVIIDSNFTNNSAQTHGGAIKLRGNNTNIVISSSFDGNYAPYAGAISLGTTESLYIFDSNFTNNKGTSADIIGGGAIYIIGNLTNARILETEFINNSARAGGAIFVEGIMDNSTFLKSFFQNNTAFTNNTKYGGGAIAVQGNATNNKFNVLLFTANTGTTHGGAINFMGNAINNTFVECEFLNNNAKYGSDIAVNKNTENLNFGQCNFKSSSEAAQEVIGGGALYFINNVTNINIDECNFTDYTARAGGAISFDKTVEKSVIQNTLFTNNTITTQNWNYGGGAIFIEGTASDLTIRNCEFINNTASTEGGAIFINNGEKVLIDGVTFSKNTAEDGGALYLKDGNNVTIQNSAFVNNTGFGSDIHYAGNIISSIINSTFDGTKHIVADETAILTLSNNKELDPYLDDDYFIYNEGALFLENNTLSNVIYNNGMIFSPTTMTTLLNETYNTTESFIYLNAYCEDDNGNSIVSDYGTFHINDNELKVFYDDNTLIGNTILPEHGSYLIYTTTYGPLYGCTQKYAIINYNPKKDIIINASDIELEIGQYGEIEVELSENATGTVTTVVDDEQYMAPVKDGKATIIIRPLEPGEYEAFIYYSGDNNYQSNHTTSVVTVLDKISVVAPDVTKYYHGPERLVVNVTQSGKAIANATVEITINGGTYTRQTDENGTVSLGLNLESGSYIATVKVDDIEVNTNVTILPTVNGTDVTKVFRNNTQYYATFRDSQGNYLKDGSNVRFNINGVMYDRKVSGDKGLAKLNINLQQGDYIITVMNLVTGENTANNITVIPRIIENNDITKYYRNGTQYTVKIIGDDGKPVGAGESVTFNINGVFYTRQTDANGTAKLNINLQPGDYIITAEYKGCMVSNNIKVLPVLTATDLVKKYGTMTPFEANLVDGQGKAYANQKIEFNINGIFYYRNTDGNGVAKLNINLMAGEYIITSTYNACSISNKVTIIL
ncbi:right-handed parallel beta-helix repeat-containing protein [uncultured Methanobrevibacter sp.]|uniref:right-handed parallel beta-helix repeat-containing protein n=1 Tax=uncultured Methanobrevibacter sp. TaxID=253161 RepID=UPI0025E679AE|nr:right-handed parallel beta-helix repeat-containing protein [uncultured Methanobrevibacter sp.]